MDSDLRCCGTGTCIINAEGRCWCGQQWDGEKMRFDGAPAPLPADAQAADSNWETDLPCHTDPDTNL